MSRVENDYSGDAFVFLGPPASGKTSHTVTFAEILNAELVRGRDIVPVMVPHCEGTRSLIPDRQFAPALKERLSRLTRNPIFFDNIPRTAPQAEVLVDWAQGLEKVIRTVVLSLSEEEVLYRFQAREACPLCGESYHPLLKPSRVENRCDKDLSYLVRRSGDKPENIKRAFVNYRIMIKEVVPVLKRGGTVYHLSAVGTVAQTASRIAAELGFGQST
ncbi:MAG: hypothetical protein C4562_06465 [Actinobacteria bacterium]|nr:MAG: hypothetical protein C4562_06465 [Actinomycetota bacterium]